MADPETEVPPEAAPEPASEPTLTGAPIGARKPDVPLAPVTNPDIPELQDRRRPRS